MKANFNIAKNVRNSRSISALSTLRKLQSIGLLLCALMIGSLQVWGTDYVLVKNISNLSAGDNVLLVSNATDHEALGTTQNNNNRASVSVTISSETISSPGNTIDVLTVGKDGNYWTFYSNNGSGTGCPGYLYAASSSSNYLRTQTSNDNNGKWTVSISADGTASIVANGTNTRNVMQYNSSSHIFACYSSASQKAVFIYKEAPSGYTVTITKNNDSYGTVTQNSVTGVTSGTSISASGNVLSVGATNVTATPNSGYNFTGWTGIPGGGTVTGNVTVTANFAAVSYTNYRTLCSTTDPSLSVSPASLNELDYIVGSGPSAAKSFSMSGSNLESGTLTVTAPTNFQVSKASGSGWANSITFTGVSGTLAATTVYVRLVTGKSAGEYSGNVEITGCGLESAVNVALSGTVFKPTIIATPASVSWSTAVGVAPTTQSVTITGTHLKGAISATLNGTDAGSFSISTTSIAKATAEGAGGTITITYTGSYAATTTKTANIQLTASDATTVNVPITFNVITDPNLYFLTDLEDINPKDKVIIVATLNVSLGEELREYYALKNATTTSTYPPDAIDVEEMISSNKQTLSYSGTDLQWNINYNSVSGEFTINRDGDDDVFLYCIDNNKGLSVGTSGTNNTYVIDDDYIKSSALTRYLGVYNSDDWRTYSSPSTNINDQAFSFYTQPSTDPYVTLGASFSEFTYEYNHGPSTPQSFTISGANLSENLIVTAPSNYQVCKTIDGTYTNSVSFTPSTGTVSEQTVYIHLAAGLAVGDYDYAQSGGLSVTSTGADAVKAALEGSVTPETFTVTATSNNGSYGSVSPASQNTSTTATITATPESGYRVISGAGGYTVTSGTATVVNNGNNTFTVTPTTDCTVQINFEAIVMRNVTWKNNGIELTAIERGSASTIVEEGGHVSAVPAALASGGEGKSCDTDNYPTFVGWTANPIIGNSASAPSDLFADAAHAPIVSGGDVVYHAVWAKGTGESPKITITSADCTDNEVANQYSTIDWSVTATDALSSTISGKVNAVKKVGYLQVNNSKTPHPYNTDALPSAITHIKITQNGGTCRAWTPYLSATMSNPSGVSATALEAKTPASTSGSVEWDVDAAENFKYFRLYVASGATQVGSIEISFGTAGYESYITSCSCEAYSMHFGTRDASDWSDKDSYCFQESTDPDGNTGVYWYLNDFELPAKPHYYVGWQGSWNTTDAKSADADFSDLVYGLLRANSCGTQTLGTYSSGNNQGAIGTLRVRSSYTDNNKYIDFIPGGYVLRLSDNNGSSYTSTEFVAASANLTETVWTTNVMTVSAALASSGKYFVDLKTSSDHVWAPNMSEVANISSMGYKKDGGSSAGSWGTGLSAGMRGKFRIWADNCSKNWNAHFVPYYHLSYDGNGAGVTNLPEASDDKSCEGNDAARTVIVSSTVPTRDGYTFIGWNTAPGGDGTAKSAGDNIVLTSDVTLYAQWAQNFTVTYDLDGGTASPACAGGTYYVGETVDVCGSTPTRVSSEFTGWLVYKTGDKSTTVTVSAGQFTMPAYNVTVEAQYTTVYWRITYKTEGDATIATDDVPRTMETTLRDETPCVGYSFVGWSTSKITVETTTKPTATLIGKGGASYTPTADITVYPVFARVEGASDKNDVITYEINGGVGSYTAFSNVSYVSDAKYAGCTTKTDTDLQTNGTNGIVTTTSGGRLKHIQVVFATACAASRGIQVYGKNTAYSAFASGSFPTGAAAGTAIASASKVNAAYNGEETFELPAADEEFEDEYNYIAITGTGGSPRITSIKVTWSTGTTYYATHCETKTDVTITYDANGGTTTCGNGSHQVTWDYADGGAGAPALAESQTICSAATRDGYVLHDWTTSQDGSGTHYNPGQTVTSMDGDKTLYAQWDRVYTVTFVDHGLGGGDVNVIRTQASLGATISVPGATTPCTDEVNEPDEYTWEFAGWGTVDNLSKSVAHHIVIASGTGTYVPEDDMTLYAVYRKNIGTSDAFDIGTSGAYKISVQQSGPKTCYATTKNAGGTAYYCSTDASSAGIFYLDYVNSGVNQGKYTLRNSDGEYIGHTMSSANLTHSLETPEYYNLVDVSGSGWRLQYANETTRYFSHGSGSSDNNYSAKQETNKCTLTPADRSYYYTTMSCGDDFSITFHDNGGVISWKVGHAESTYQHLSDGEEVSVFPTATFDGWTFLGWRTSNYTENTSAPEASTIYGGTDGESGNHFFISSNTDMYPVFTRFEDNEPIDLVNGGDYYIYFLDEGSDDGYGAARRVYATSYAAYKRYSSTAICTSATEFTFTKLENGNWTIKDKSTGEYLYGIADDDLKQQASATGAEWTLTLNGSQFDAFHVGTSYGQISAFGDGTSATFMNYRRTNIGTNPSYHRVYLGSCTNRTFTTNPSTTPEIDLKGTAVVTASQNGAIRATNVLTVSGHNLTPSTGTITISSNNSDIYFSKNTDDSFAEGKAAADNPKSSVTVTANSSGIVAATAIYVHYKPTGNTDGVTNVTVTATYSGAEDATTTVKARRVKENFVIAAKVADSWYALPANMSSSDVYAPTLIEVDESSNVAYGPSTVAYKLWPVKTTNGSGNRYAAAGDEVRFTGNSDNALWANNASSGTTTGIRNWAVVNSIDDGGSGSGEDLDERYEWVISTEDGDAYTINTNQSNNKRNLVIYRKNGQLVWATNGSCVTNELHLIPLTERATINIIPREWKTNGLVFAIAADNNISLTSGHTTAKIGTGDAASATITRHSTGGYGLYEVALPDLTSHYGKVLTLKMKISGVDTYATATIPIIVNANASTKDNTPFSTLGAESQNYDVVVLSGKTLTTNAIASGACKFQNLYLYPGATLVNTANGNLSVSYLEMRGGIKGIDAKSSLEQDVPRLLLGKSMSSTAGANLDMYVNTAHSYALSVPFDVTLSNVNFANSLNTTTSAPINGALDAQFMIMEYDGAQRVSTGKGWKHITSTERVLHAGEGYVLQGKRPKGQPFAVIRFPFTGVNSWADNTNGEVAKSDIPIYAHNGGATTPDNEKGWNLIANPYMATISYSGQDEGWAADFTVGTLEKTDTDPWDGKYEWESKTNAYVTMPNDSYTAFPQYRANSAQAVFKPFMNFFIQTDADGSVTFDRSLRASAPRHLLALAAKAQPIYADINLTHGEAFAQAGLTIDENATAGYKFGEDQNIFENREALDYLKMYTISDDHYLVGNTLTPAETAEMIPLEFYAPNMEGEYIFSLDENSDIDRLEYVILYDAELGLNTNLLTDDYTVELDKSGLIENRFSLGLKIKEKDNSATGIDDVGGNPEQPYKFIYRDKMYILRGGKLYDATGKQVQINK